MMAASVTRAKPHGAARRPLDPRLRLIIALRAAAKNIGLDVAHRTAAQDAERIPKIYAERLPATLKGRIARQARALMAQLPALGRDELGDAAIAMRAFADILATDGPSPVIAEDWLGRRKRKASSSEAVGRKKLWETPHV